MFKSTFSLAMLSVALLVTTPVAFAQDSQQDAAQSQKNQDQQSENNNQQSSEAKQQSDGEKDSDQLQLSMIELKHASYAEMKSLLTLHGLNECFLGGRDANCFVAFDVDTKTMFVRASEDKINKIKGIVKKFDVASDQFPTQVDVGEDRVARLVDRQKASKLTMTLRELGYSVEEQNLVNDRLVIYDKKDSKKREEVEKIIDKILDLDKEKKGEKEEEQQASN